MSKIVLYGYFGYQNFGDDLMLHNIIEHLYKSNSIKIITNSKNNTEISSRKSITVHETYKYNKLKNLVLLYKIFKKCDFFVWGGGTCFSEEDGVVNPLILILARILRLKIVFIGIGSNKIRSFNNKLKMKINSLLIDKVYVRDQDSLQNLSIFFNDNKIVLSEDIAYLYDYNKPYIGKDKQITISLRNLNNYLAIDEQHCFMNNIVKSIRDIICGEDFEEINVLVLDNKIDYEINQKFFQLIKDDINQNIRVNFINEKNITAKISSIQESGFFICVRLHGILVSELIGVKTIGIGYSEKVKSYMNRIGSSGYIEMKDIIYNKDSLVKKYKEVKNSKSKVNLEFQKKKALKNFEMFTQSNGKI